MERNATTRMGQSSMTSVCPSSYSSDSKRNPMVSGEFVTFRIGYGNRDSLASGRNISCIDGFELVPMMETDVRRNQRLGSPLPREPGTGMLTYMVADPFAHKTRRAADGKSICPGNKSDLIVCELSDPTRNTRYVTHLAREGPRETPTQLLPRPLPSRLVTARCFKSDFTRTRACRENAMQELGGGLYQRSSEANLCRGPSGSKSCPNLGTLGFHYVDPKTTQSSLIRFVRQVDDPSWNGRALLDSNKASSVLRKDLMDYGHYRAHRFKLSRSSAEGSRSIRCLEGQYPLAYGACIDSSDHISVLDTDEPPARPIVQGVATESTPLRLASAVRPGKPPSRRHKVSDSYRQTAVFYQEPSGDKGFVRWVVCIVLGLSLSALLYLYLSFHLRYEFIVATVVSSVASPLVAVTCLVSRRARCCGALAAPSLFASQTGRAGFLLLLTGVILCGPVTNICLNLREISRSFTCGIDQSYNRTMLMTNPYKALVGQLNLTMVSLQEAVVRAEDDLKPLEERLRQLNHGIHNGLLQLFGSQKACKAFVDRAYGACVTSISKAKIQCLGVLEALANVYKHAQGVLDGLNPDRWAPKSTNLTPNKRQILLMGSRGQEQTWNEVLSDDSDICEPLHSVTVCQDLNNSAILCRQSRWAGAVIHVTVNSTLTALGQLEGYLRTSVRYGPPPLQPHASVPTTGSGTPVNGTKVRQRFLDGFDNAVQTVEQSLVVVARVLPAVACVLVGWAVSSYLTLYMCVDPTYLPMHWLNADDTREWQSRVEPASFCFDRLLSGDATSPWDGLFVVLLHATAAAVFGFLDFSLCWVLGLVRRHSRPPFDVTGGSTLSSVVRGNGTLAKILREFLAGFHPGHWFGFFSEGYVCMPASSAPSLLCLSVLVALYGLLVAGVALKRRLSLVRNAICGRFYPERALARSECLSGVIRAKRTRVLRSIKAAATAAASTAGTEQKTAICEGDLLRHLMDLHPDDATSSICHRLLFQRVSLCIVCRSSMATHACPCPVCQQLDPVARVRCCGDCMRAIEGNTRSPSLCRDSSNGYVDLI